MRIRNVSIRNSRGIRELDWAKCVHRQEGASPRTGGTPVVRHPVVAGKGCIPARTGEPDSTRGGHVRAKVHPRARGNHIAAAVFTIARGRIPALTGESLRPPSAPAKWGVHPRAHGGTSWFAGVFEDCDGSRYCTPIVDWRTAGTTRWNGLSQ
jgi:hypothetical protein